MDLKLQHDSVSCGTLTVWALQLASVWQQQGGVEPFSTYFTRQALRYYKDGVPDKSACRALEVRLRQEYCSAAGLMAARPNGPPFGVEWTVSYGHGVRTSSATSASSSVPPAMRRPPASTPTPSMPPHACRTPAAAVVPPTAVVTPRNTAHTATSTSPSSESAALLELTRGAAVEKRMTPGAFVWVVESLADAPWPDWLPMPDVVDDGLCKVAYRAMEWELSCPMAPCLAKVVAGLREMAPDMVVAPEGATVTDVSPAAAAAAAAALRVRRPERVPKSGTRAAVSLRHLVATLPCLTLTERVDARRGSHLASRVRVARSQYGRSSLLVRVRSLCRRGGGGRAGQEAAWAAQRQQEIHRKKEGFCPASRYRRTAPRFRRM